MILSHAGTTSVLIIIVAFMFKATGLHAGGVPFLGLKMFICSYRLWSSKNEQHDGLG